jgi:hypothetical protein
MHIPRDIRDTMDLCEFFPKIRAIVGPTLKIMADRFLRFEDELGWIDMKFDPVDGRDRINDAHYRRDRVYSWIQGRALESLVVHQRWLARLEGYSAAHFAAETGRLDHIAGSLYSRMLSVCLPGEYIQVPFVMDSEGTAAGENRSFGHDETTLSHLFVLRGLASFAGYTGKTGDLSRILPALRKAVDASIRGECLDDQVRFGDSGGESYSSERKGYEGQMIALGACEILHSITGDPDDLSRGLETIRCVIRRFLQDIPGIGPVMVDAFGPDGKAILTKTGSGSGQSVLATNPGHAIEFAGLALQFLRHTGASLEEGLAQRLVDLVLRYEKICRAPHGGIVRSMEAATGSALEAHCPWWSSFEAARTFAEIYGRSKSPEERRTCVDRIRSYLDCIQKAYIAPSSIGVPVQTLSSEGSVLPIIPATPDIDPGYHTGIPLIDVYEVLALQSTMASGFAECRIPFLHGKRLQGHIARTLPAESEMDPLHIRCAWLCSPWTQVLMASADVLEFSHDWSDSLCKKLSCEYGVPEDNILLFATHTHTAPSTLDLGLVHGDKEFLDLVERSLMKALVKAGERIEPAVAILGIGEVPGIGVNRRSKDPNTGIISMRPNTAGDRDDSILSMFFLDRNSALRGVAVNTAVHPTTLGVGLHEISADYPGTMASKLKKALGADVVVIPLQGSCGDVRPAVVSSDGREFSEGSKIDIDRIGGAIAACVVKTWNEALSNPKWISGNGLSLRAKVVDLPISPLPNHGQVLALAKSAQIVDTSDGGGEDFAKAHDNPSLMAESYKAWAQALLESSFDVSGQYTGPTSVKGRFSLLRIGDDCALFSLPGEAFCHIGKTLKKKANPAALIVGCYCNGSLGYIPTAKAWDEGGYEVEAAFRFYGFPGPLARETESMIYSLFETMRKEAST